MARLKAEAMKPADEEGNENKQEGLDLVQECPGAAIIVVILTPNNDIICANAGDCRAVLCQNGVPVALSKDHKPYHAEEKKELNLPVVMLAMKEFAKIWHCREHLGISDTKTDTI